MAVCLAWYQKIPKGKYGFHGCLGIHVDDGIGGGDQYFKRVIGKLREIYSFGAYNEGEFEFCGVHYFQWDDGSIELEQKSYIQKISPIEIPRSRRVDPKSSLTAAEVQMLRQICGSLQYSAVHTRPDLAAKVGELQAAIPHGRIEHLISANRVLYEAKTKAVSLMIVPIKESDVTFCAFSDASFESTKGESFTSRDIDFCYWWQTGCKLSDGDMSNGMVIKEDPSCCSQHFKCWSCSSWFCTWPAWAGSESSGNSWKIQRQTGPIQIKFWQWLHRP